MAETWVVLGGSSAIARAFAREAAARGCDLLLAGRDLEDIARSAADAGIRGGRRAEALAFDAADPESHAAFVETCRAKAEGPINLFLAFGYMPEQAAAERDAGLAQRTLEVTYLGAVSVLERFAELFESQKRGRIVVLGSVAGDRGRRSNYIYGSAKAGLHAYLQGLRARLHGSGVSVTTVKPGFIDTAMTWGLPGLFLVATPADCARACLRAAEAGAESIYYPRFWWAIMAIIRAIPERIFKRLPL